MQDTEIAMQKAITAVKKHFTNVRTGRANPSLLEDIKVDYYGTTTILKQLASISVPETRQLLITPFDKTITSSIEKAIITSDLGLNPQTSTDSIRINIPPLTTERRKELVKIVRQIAEDGKVSVRNARHAFLKNQDKETSEDTKKKEQDQVQKLTNNYTNEIDLLLKEKEKEIMET